MAPSDEEALKCQGIGFTFGPLWVFLGPHHYVETYRTVLPRAWFDGRTSRSLAGGHQAGTDCQGQLSCRGHQRRACYIDGHCHFTAAGHGSLRRVSLGDHG